MRERMGKGAGLGPSHAQRVAREAGAPGRATRTAQLQYRHRVGSRSPAPTIHDVATAAVETKGAGEPVDPGVRSRTEARTGADLSGARVHRDADAQLAASAIGARAFAYRHDVFLGPGESPQDSALMAHELTHVVQQGGAPAPQRKVEVGADNDPAEREADAVAADVVGSDTAHAGRIVADGATLEPGQQTRSAFL